MALIAPRVTAGLPAEDAQKLRFALDGSHDITVFVDGTVHRLPPAARDAVVDLLGRFSRPRKRYPLVARQLQFNRVVARLGSGGRRSFRSRDHPDPLNPCAPLLYEAGCGCCSSAWANGH